jgi:hypothetical protein
MDRLKSEVLFEMSGDLETPHGTRVIVYAKGGQVDGGDWLE